MRPIVVSQTGVGNSSWVRFDDYSDTAVTIQVVNPSGATFTIQETMDDPNSPTNPVAVANVNWVNSADASVVNATGTNVASYFAYKPVFARLNVSVGAGTVTATFGQAGGGNY